MRALSLVVSILLAACAAPASAPAAAPTEHPLDPSCTGECLTGKDPFESGCAADARTVKLSHAVTSTGQVIGVVELRVSPACATAWTRILRTDEMPDGEIVGGVTVDGGATWLTHRAKHAISLWTDMRHLPADACAAASVVLYDDSGRALADEARADSCERRMGAVSEHRHGSFSMRSDGAGLD